MSGQKKIESKTDPKVRSSAKQMAGEQIDRLEDASASGEEKGRRKQRLLEGPEEFHEIRKGKPKC